jgi:hypothetical protein
VGGHHQNGIVEQKIKELILGAWTFLLNAKQMLPEYISTIFWPFSLKCAEDRLNNLVHQADGCIPYEKIANLDSSKIKISNFHTFGSLFYVLDKRLQSGASMIPKWEPRARMGIYVGQSPSHTSNVALVLNPRTGPILPQFHVAFDDDFTTVEYLLKVTVPPHWAELVCSSAEIQVYSEHQASTWQSLPDIDKLAIFCTSKQLLPLLLKLVRELKLELFTTSKTIKYHFQRSMCKLKRRSIVHLLPISILKTCGKCHQQLILIPVVYIVPLKLKYSDVVTRFTLTLHKHIKLHPCIQLFQICLGASLLYLLCWTWIAKYSSFSSRKSYQNITNSEIDLLKSNQQLSLS